MDEIKIQIKNYRCFPDTRPARINLKNRFTALVGINNAGKSSLLKFFYEFRNLFERATNLTELNNSMRGPRPLDFPSTVLDLEELFSNTNTREIVIEVTVNVKNNVGSLIPATFRFTIPRARSEFVTSLILEGNTIGPDDLSFPNNTIRTVRGTESDLTPLLDACRKLASTLYIGPFRNAINIGTQTNYFDMQIGQAFIEKWRQIKEGRSKRSNDSAIKVTADIKEIFDYDSLEINPSDDNQSLTIYANKKSYKLHELGAGISQFIIVLVSASLASPSFILIDEPEINLHPSLQLDFLTTLASYAREGIIFSTHSIGLAKASAEEVLSVRKIEEGISEITAYEDTPDLPVFIGELSFSNYSELGFEKILLVEGVTEVKLMQQLLRKQRKDHKIVIVPLGGGAMIKATTAEELSQITRITKNTYVIIDSEKSSEKEALSKERTGFAENCEKAGIKCLVLERRATENYLTESAIRTAMRSEKYSSLQPFQKLEDLDPTWSKSDNWKIAKEMKTEELKDTDLGKFLSSL